MVIMIRIKDLIVNENEIVYIGEFDEDNKLRVRTSKEVWFDIPNATFDDIEWSYLSLKSSSKFVF